MQPHNWKNLLFSIWLASNITKGCGIAVNTALAVNLDMENTGNSPRLNESLQLELQPRDFLPFSPTRIEQLLHQSQRDKAERLERLRRRLRVGRQPISDESDSFQDMGLRVREKPLPELKPIGNLQARFGYYHTSNVFSSDVNPIEDGLISFGVKLASVYFPLGSQTFVNGSIDGSLGRYVNQSIYNYNRVKFYLSVYQQLSPRMHGTIAWSNQQLFYAKNSDRFLSENSLSLSLGRRDSLTPQLTLNSFYEFKLNFAEPNSRSRMINSGRVSLNYRLQQPLKVGLNYQLKFSEFTQRQRNDYYHQLYASLIYQISDSSKINLQSGWRFGDSTDKKINFDGWFFSINYNWRLGQF
ncbi:hypothetical protein A2T98_17985 [Nodularia spumigena CENA596]|uniref:Uncharacterized protein n=1 Tax=Nodularia spumigena CENA596 TaxID=1819295 RepID=A0A166IIC6_NODSP|nr:hypothetical protein A2T98_17985 [Nodularia spumigena CENA596]